MLLAPKQSVIDAEVSRSLTVTALSIRSLEHASFHVLRAVGYYMSRGAMGWLRRTAREDAALVYDVNHVGRGMLGAMRGFLGD